MAFADKKGIAVASGFKLQAEVLLDARQAVDTIAERDELVTIHAAAIGLIVYVKEKKISYQWNGEAWMALAKAVQLQELDIFKGATTTADGVKGFVPAPAAGDKIRYLASDGTWKVLSFGSRKSDDNGGLEITDEHENVILSLWPVTASDPGVMTSDLFTKLNGIEAGANKYVHPTTAGNKHIPAGGASGQILKWDSDGTAKWAVEKTYSVMTGASGSAAGTSGLVPAPTTGQLHSILFSNGLWGTINAEVDTTSEFMYLKLMHDNTEMARTIIPAASSSGTGLITSTMYDKIDGIEERANNYTHPATHAANIITEDANHRFATDQEKAKWNNKSDFMILDTAPSSCSAGAIVGIIQ